MLTRFEKIFLNSYSLFLLLLIVFSCTENRSGSESGSLSRDTLHWPVSFAFGRLATPAEIAMLDIDVRPDGVGLPKGSGTVAIGKLIYASKCALCHGKTGTEGPYNPLVTNAADNTTKENQRPEKTIGNYWPYATTLYDYINRAMPYNTPGTLTPDEVYSLTAFLLHANDLIDSSITLDAETLPKVVMPAQKLFVTDDRKGGAEIR